MDLALGMLIFGWLFVIIWVPVVILTQRKVHPKALFVLFFAELWERFSFYGMRALLILYMVQELFKDMSAGEADIKSYGIYGSYMALVYATPVIGGLIADRIYGFRNSILLGGLLMAAGHFVLAIEGIVWVFFIALALIIVGNGFFKPNISSFLGTFYSKNDARKDGAFTIFYMGVNIGAFLAPLTCGYLGQEYDWSYGFGLAGIGMLVGLLVFWLNLKNLKGEDYADADDPVVPPIDQARQWDTDAKHDIPKTEQGKTQVFHERGLPPNPEDLRKPYFLGLNKEILIIGGSLIAVLLCAFLLNFAEYMKWGLFTIGAIIIAYLLYTSFNTTSKKEGQRLMVVVVLFFFHMIFWALFEQAGGSLTLFTERNVDRTIFGSSPIPASMFQSLNPLFIMLLAPVFSWIWLRLNRIHKEPNTPMKFALGLLQLASGFGILLIGIELFGADGLIPMIFLVLMYLLHTTGELSLSPVGLSMVTKLSPAKIVGFVMGAWFMSIALAHEIAAELGKLTSVPAEDAPLVETLAAYADVYLIWGVVVVGAAGLLLMLLSKPLHRMMHGIH